MKPKIESFKGGSWSIWGCFEGLESQKRRIWASKMSKFRLIIALRIIWHELEGFQKIFVHTLGNETRLQGIPDESIESLTNQDRPGGLRAAL